MSKFLLFTPLLILVLLLSACSDNSQDEANAILSTNEYVLTALDKKQYVLTKEANGFRLEDAHNKIILLDILATWCPPCQAEASHLSSLQKKYKDEIVIIGVSVEENVQNRELKKFREDYDAHYALVNSDQNRRLINTLATDLKLGRNFGIPLLVMYKDGKLLNYYQGAVEEEFIESDIKKALGK